MRPRRAVAGTTFARAALLIAVLTVFARVAGLGRVLVFARTVGTNCLGDTYQAVNAVPNIVFEVVAGGALAGAVVPVLAHPVERGDRAVVDATASALLSWVLLTLSAIAVVVALCAQPIAAYLLAAKPCGAAAATVGARLLRVFAPQIPLYGLGIVLTGVLQAHRRFTGPALAPLLSSIVVIGTYLAYLATARPGTGIAEINRTGELVLSVGTTLGVAVLCGGLLLPLARTPVRLRPALRFPPGVARRTLGLAGAGLAALLAQQAAVLVTLKLGNGSDVPAGQYTGFTYAQTITLLPWAVLAVPVATAIFPRLAQAHDAGEVAAYAGGVAAAIRSVVIMSLLGAALLAAAAGPIARVVVEGAAAAGTADSLAAGVTAMAPGVVGYGLFAVLSRALFAAGRPRSVTVAAVTGWCAVVGADIALSVALPPGERLLALAAGSSVGMTVLGAALLIAVRRRVCAPALSGVGRAAYGGLFAAVPAVVVGRIVAAVLAGGGPAAAAGEAALVGAAVLLVFGGVAAVSVGSDLNRLLTWTGFRRA